MDKQSNHTPGIYAQPIRDFLHRTVIDQYEDVDFVPNTGMRIWYNNQIDAYPLHKHSAIEIAIPVESEYKYIVDGKRYNLAVGDIFFIPPHTLHEIEHNEEGARLIYLFDIRFMQRFFDYPELERFLSEPRLVNHYSHPELYDTIYNCFMKMNDLYFMYTDKLCEMTIFSYLLRVFGELTRYEDENASHIQNGGTTHHSDNQNKFKSLISYVNDHYMDDLTLDFAATYVGFSKFHFTRRFKEYTDLSFYDYLSQKRIQSAKIMLFDESLSITDIAYRCGFNSPSTFTRCFQKYVNCTPSELRIALRKER